MLFRSLSVATCLLLSFAPLADAIDGAPLPQVTPVGEIKLRGPRYGHSSALVWPYLYLMGGFGGSGLPTNVERVDLSPGSAGSSAWLADGSILPRMYGAAALGDGEIYLFGGYELLPTWHLRPPTLDDLRDGVEMADFIENLSVARMQSAVEVIDLAVGTVRQTAEPMARPRWVLEAQRVDGRIVLAGGAELDVCRCCRMTRCNAVDFFDLATERFSAAPRMSISRETSTALLPNGKIVAFGGYNGTTTRLDVEEYEPREGPQGTWRTLADLPFASSTGGTVVWEGHVISIGDYNRSRLILAGDPETGLWHRGECRVDMPNQSSAHVHDGLIYVVGGKTKLGHPVDRIQIFDAAELWRALSGAAQ